MLFNDTIRYNVQYGRPGAPDDAVESASVAAQIHDRICSFPDGESPFTNGTRTRERKRLNRSLNCNRIRHESWGAWSSIKWR